jgi:hypothetical protein
MKARSALLAFFMQVLCGAASAASVAPVFTNDTTANTLSFNDTFGHNVQLGTYDPATGLWTSTGVAGGFTNLTVSGNGTVAGTFGIMGATSVGALSATGAVNGAGFTNLFASPPPTGSTAPNTGAFTTLSASGMLSGAGFNSLISAPPVGVGSVTPNGGSFTSLSASGTVSGAGFANYLLSPPAIGNTAPNTGAFTTLTESTTPSAGDKSTKVANTAFVAANQQCLIATSQGFVGDGSTDNTTAWSNYKTAVGSTNACLFFPAGVYAFNSAPTAWTLAASQTLTFSGSGPDVMELYFPNNNTGFVFSFTQSAPDYIAGSALNFSNASVTTNQLGAGDGIKITGNSPNNTVPKSTFIKNVSFRGHSSGKYWTNALNFQNLYQVMVEDTSIYGPDNTFNLGTGILFNGPSSTAQSIVLNVSNLNAYFLNVGINATGTHQGVNVQQSNITGVTTGVACGDGTSGGSQCIVANSQIEAVHNNVILNLPGGAMISNNLFILGARAGALTTDFILKMTTSPNTVVSNNIFDATNSGSGSFPSCVDLSNGTGNPHSTFTGNSYVNCTTGYKASAANSLGITSIGNSFQGTISPNWYVNLSLGGSSHNVLDDSGPGLAVADSVHAAQLYRHLGASPAAPTSCGTSPSIGAGSTDEFGTFTTGSGAPTACTITFAAPNWSTAVVCEVQGQNTFTLAAATATTTTLSIAFSAASTSQTWGYHCIGN